MLRGNLPAKSARRERDRCKTHINTSYPSRGYSPGAFGGPSPCAMAMQLLRARTGVVLALFRSPVKPTVCPSRTATSSSPDWRRIYALLVTWLSPPPAVPHEPLGFSLKSESKR
eukprot:scaffold78541_cov62-Phaeocystis_antarctica.AAC.1